MREFINIVAKANLLEATGTNTWARTRVDPDLLNMIALRNQYQREVEKAKAQQPKTKQTRENYYTVYNISISGDKIKHWIETHDKTWAFQTAKKWRAQKMPPEFIEYLTKDPDWQKAVLDIWQAFENLFKSNNRSASSNREASLCWKLQGVIDKYRRELRVDKYGVILPSSPLLKVNPPEVQKSPLSLRYRPK